MSQTRTITQQVRGDPIIHDDQAVYNDDQTVTSLPKKGKSYKRRRGIPYKRRRGIPNWSAYFGDILGKGENKFQISANGREYMNSFIHEILIPSITDTALSTATKEDYKTIRPEDILTNTKIFYGEGYKEFRDFCNQAIEDYIRSYDNQTTRKKDSNITETEDLEEDGNDYNSDEEMSSDESSNSSNVSSDEDVSDIID